MGMRIKEQIARGILVCPRTKQRLSRQDDLLVTETGQQYPVINGVPVLAADAARLESYLAENAGRMQAEYAAPVKPKGKTLFEWIEGWQSKPADNYRSSAARAAWAAVEQLSNNRDAVCISIGGGPDRQAKDFLNLNIGLFPNVEIVADAYRLPYADDSVDAICCIAVLEHLEFPDRAIAEAIRVLKPGAEAYFDTPFLQPFHGYPNHFQGFTLIGHERLMTRHGFGVVSSGASVGPSHVFYHMVLSWFLLYSKWKWLRLAVSTFLDWTIRPQDKRLNHHPAAHAMASTTYVHVRKPSGAAIRTGDDDVGRP